MSAEPGKNSQWIANLVILVLLFVVAAGLAKRYVFVKPPSKIAADARELSPVRQSATYSRMEMRFR